MSRTEQSAHRTGHEEDHASQRNWSATAETLELEDMAQAFGARMPASIIPFPTKQRDASFGAHPFS